MKYIYLKKNFQKELLMTIQNKLIPNEKQQ